MYAIRIHDHGGVERLSYEEVAAPVPSQGEVRVKLKAAGVNYIDTYHRRGMYDQALPFTLGVEGGGVVDMLGEGVTELQLGDYVAYAMNPGSYAEYATVPEWKAVRLPTGMPVETATAIMLQGMTAHYLTHSTYPVGEGDVVLIHAAAGGMGLLLVRAGQIARRTCHWYDFHIGEGHPGASAWR